MSFARFALRHAAVQALRGATLVGAHVRNSDFKVLDIAADGTLRDADDRPFILVYTDDSDAPQDRIDLRQNGTVEVVFEFGIASAMGTIDPDTGESVYFPGVAATDEGAEYALDLIERQIAAALHADTDWADLWRSLIDGAEKKESKRATLDNGGSRLAARQVRFFARVKPDPVYGEPLAPTSVWQRFAAAVAGTEAEEQTAAMLGTPGEAMTWDVLRTRFGFTRGARAALHFGPADDARPEALVAGHEVEDDG